MHLNLHCYHEYHNWRSRTKNESNSVVSDIIAAESQWTSILLLLYQLLTGSQAGTKTFVHRIKHLHRDQIQMRTVRSGQVHSGARTWLVITYSERSYETGHMNCTIMHSRNTNINAIVSERDSRADINIRAWFSAPEPGAYQCHAFPFRFNLFFLFLLVFVIRLRLLYRTSRDVTAKWSFGTIIGVS